MKAGTGRPGGEDRLDRLKTVLEIAALAIGALFLLAKLIDGEAHSAMQVSLELKREPIAGSCETELLAAKLGLERSAVGVLKLTDITLTLSDPLDERRPTSPGPPIRDTGIVDELKREKHGGEPAPWIYLPPNEGTELGYATIIKRNVPVAVEAKISTVRTVFGVWQREQQWRASAVSLPSSKEDCAPKSPKGDPSSAPEQPVRATPSAMLTGAQAHRSGVS